MNDILLCNNYIQRYIVSLFKENPPLFQQGDFPTIRYGGFAEEFGKEFEDVSRNLRSVGFGRNSKGDSSFLYFILLWIY